jgi:hypothetical protein
LDARDRLIEICLALPEANVEDVEHEQHLIFRVRKRTFAYYLHNHHGDGEIAVTCKVEQGMNTALVDSDSETFFLPAYLHHRGWVAIRLTARELNWDDVADFVEMSYRLIAPKTLVRQIL